MKVFINDKCYVNVFDLYRKDMPSYLRDNIENYGMNDFVEIRYNSAKIIIKNREDILDYNDILFCSDSEIKRKIKDLKFKIICSEFVNINDNNKYVNISKTDIYKAIYNELKRYLANNKEINKEIEVLAVRSKRKLLMK